MKVAIVCDWLVGTGGAERVVLELHKMFPEAPIYTSQYNPDPKVWYGKSWFADADVRTTWLQHLPLGLRKFLPVLRAWTFSRLDLSSYDLVISSTGAEAKAVKTGPKTVHVCYCLAPSHYYWSRYDQYLAHPGFGLLDPLARLGLKLLVGPMRRWDRKAAQKPNYMIGISNHIKAEIKKYYGRDAAVIHPPVDTGRFKTKSSNQRSGFITTGRQTPYKKIDLAVAACSRLNLPLIVIGNGPDHQKLVRLAGPTVQFITTASDQQVAEYLAGSEAFIFPGVDDFGIVSVEAMASGAPVIAYKGGGALDYVKPGETGEFFEPQTAEALEKVLKNFKPEAYKSDRIAVFAGGFSAENFRLDFKKYLSKLEF